MNLLNKVSFPSRHSFYAICSLNLLSHIPYLAKIQMPPAKTYPHFNLHTSIQACTQALQLPAWLSVLLYLEQGSVHGLQRFFGGRVNRHVQLRQRHHVLDFRGELRIGHQKSGNFALVQRLAQLVDVRIPYNINEKKKKKKKKWEEWVREKGRSWIRQGKYRWRCKEQK